MHVKEQVLRLDFVCHFSEGLFSEKYSKGPGIVKKKRRSISKITKIGPMMSFGPLCANIV